MKVATTMKIIVTTTMDMVLHNGYVRLLVEVVDGDGDVNKGEDHDETRHYHTL